MSISDGKDKIESIGQKLDGVKREKEVLVG